MLTSLSARTLPRLLLLLAGTGLGVALFVFLFRSVNLDQLGNDFTTVDYGYLALAVVPFLINLLVKIPRWALLFGEDAPGWDTLFGAMNVGYAVNALLPARLGEIVRAYWIRDRAGIGMVHTLSTIALERVTDGVFLIVLLAIMTPIVALPDKLLGPALTIGAVFIIVLALMILLAYGSAREGHPLHVLVARLQGGKYTFIEKAVGQIVAGIQVLRNWRAVALLLTYTVLIWGSNSVLIWLVLRAFHIDVPIAAGILLTITLNLGMALPSSPGYIGVFDYLFVLTLGIYGYGLHDPAPLAAAFGFHVIAFVPVTVIGLFYLARSGLQMTLQMVRAGASRS